MKHPDAARNQDGIGSRELLVVSFGTSYPDSRRKTIGAIEDGLEGAFPGWSIRRAFTSRVVLGLAAEREGLVMDDVDRALSRAQANGVEELVIQPTHMLNGLEYRRLREQVEQRTAAFPRLRLGQPLLTSSEDFVQVARALMEAESPAADGETALVLMGHGTTARCNEVYPRLEQVLRQAGGKDWFVGTVEAQPDLDDVLRRVQAGRYRRVVLRPLMIVAGDHANHDMAGEEADSWRGRFHKAGYEVQCRLQGLGELEGIRRIFVRHAREAMEAAEL